jgi:hypothetical protein
MVVELANLASAFQLSCALSFVFGAYSGFRREKENEIVALLSEAERLFSKLRAKRARGETLTGFAKSEPEFGGDDRKIEWLPTKELTFCDVATLRKDVTNRFYKNWKKHRKMEPVERWILWCGAIFSFVSLIFVTLAASSHSMNSVLALIWVIVSFIPPVLVMFRNYDRLRVLELSAHRVIDVDIEEARFRNSEERTGSRHGEIDFITNHIRRLARGNNIN